MTDDDPIMSPEECDAMECRSVLRLTDVTRLLATARALRAERDEARTALREREARLRSIIAVREELRVLVEALNHARHADVDGGAEGEADLDARWDAVDVAHARAREALR